MLPPSASHGLAIEVIDAQVRRLKTYAVPAQPGAVTLIERATDLVARAGDNVVEAAQAGAHIVTLFPSFLDKLPQFGRNLREYEIETSRQFLEDSKLAGFTL
jgi:hypothetical protein